MLNEATPPFRELLLNRLTPLHDRDYVRAVMRLKQREILVVVESAIKLDVLELSVKAVEHIKKLIEDTLWRYTCLRNGVRPTYNVCSSHAVTLLRPCLIKIKITPVIFN